MKVRKNVTLDADSLAALVSLSAVVGMNHSEYIRHLLHTARISEGDMGTIEKSDNNHLASCVRCGSLSALVLVPHRLRGAMVGWVFSCANCASTVCGGTVSIEYGGS